MRMKLVQLVLRFLGEPPQIFFFAIIVMMAYSSNPSSFNLSWNEGRAVLLFIIPLAIIEGGRSVFNPVGIDRSYKLYIIFLFAACYYGLSSTSGFINLLISVGANLGMNPSTLRYSWVAAVDYSMATLLIIMVILLSGKRGPVTPWIFTAGMSSFLFIDTVLPYDSLGPLQILVPPLLKVVATSIGMSGLGLAESSGNVLFISNGRNAMELSVFWPSAGLHGVIIAALAVVALSVKMSVSLKRAIAYLIGAFIGSIAINILRISLLSIYALAVDGNYNAFEQFHSSIGELVFLPWIAVYIYLIIRHEIRIKARVYLE